ncbi:hypothetical protein ABZP36_009012 [Zizania latifolia]
MLFFSLQALQDPSHRTSLPYECSPLEYFRLWPSLPAMVECTSTYTYEGSGFKATAAQQYDSSPFLNRITMILGITNESSTVVICYEDLVWWVCGFVGMMIFGASEVSQNVDLGDETTTMICKFVVCASDESITREIESDFQGWLDDITEGAVEYMPEDERIALLKAAKPKVPPVKMKEEEEEKKQNEDSDEFDSVKEQSGQECDSGTSAPNQGGARDHTGHEPKDGDDISDLDADDLFDENEKVDTTDYVGGISVDNDDCHSDEMRTLMMMIEAEDHLGPNSRAIVEVDSKSVTDKGIQVASDVKPRVISLADESIEHPVLFSGEAIRTDSSLLGVIKTKTPKVTFELAKQCDL